jgi:hypothetical protein
MSACIAAGRHCPCEGRLQEHHVIAQQWIKREHKSAKAEQRRGGPAPWGVSRVLADRRNLIRICKRHHELVEQRILYLAADELPAGVWAFAAELDRLCGRNGARPFTAWLEQQFPKRPQERAGIPPEEPDPYA